MILNRRRAIVSLGSILSAAYLSLRQIHRRPIPFLITADVHERPKSEAELNTCLERLHSTGLKITFFVPARRCLQANIAAIFRRALADGHQVACHGLTHDDEDYMTDSIGVQRQNLFEAKHLLEDRLGVTVTAFRAPAFRISKHTLVLLDSLGFHADLSICSQRLPLLSSQVSNYNLLLAPTWPYHPHPDNPYEKGTLNLLEIPNSAALIPYMSSITGMNISVIELLTFLLESETTIVSKPLVYQCHPEDFVYYRQERQRLRLGWQMLAPTGQNGIPARWALLETDGEVLYHRNQEFWRFLRNRSQFHFCSVDSYIRDRGAGAT
jgi:hypothetical protein